MILSRWSQKVLLQNLEATRTVTKVGGCSPVGCRRDQRPIENEDAAPLILGVKAGAHDFPSCRPIACCAATPTSRLLPQIQCVVPPRVAWHRPVLSSAEAVVISNAPDPVGCLRGGLLRAIRAQTEGSNRKFWLKGFVGRSSFVNCLAWRRRRVAFATPQLNTGAQRRSPFRPL
jgi:hypothetical protein